jgi:hypothetical protein
MSDDGLAAALRSTLLDDRAPARITVKADSRDVAAPSERATPGGSLVDDLTGFSVAEFGRRQKRDRARLDATCPAHSVTVFRPSTGCHTDRPRTREAGTMNTGKDEVPLSGGRITQGVVRIGDTVRRPVTARSAFVAELLNHLQQRGFTGAPRYLGLDDTGRDTFTYLPGRVPATFQLWSNDQVVAAGTLLRSLHEATRGSRLAAAHPVVCHHDPGPNNAVFHQDRPMAFIDFDTAAPGDPLEDLGYLLCERNMCPSVLCLSDWLASQLPCARSFGEPSPSAGRVHRAAVHDAAVLVPGRRWRVWHRFTSRLRPSTLRGAFAWGTRRPLEVRRRQARHLSCAPAALRPFSPSVRRGYGSRQDRLRGRSARTPHHEARAGW